MSHINSLINKIHLGNALDILAKIPDNSVALTITSPPYYDSEIYVLEDGKEEFGWRTYEEYLEHLFLVLDQIYRITIKSGRLVLVLSNSPQTTSKDVIVHYWPIVHDMVSYATKKGWFLIDEAIWIKRKPVYPGIHFKPAPDSQLNVHHDIVSILRKPGVYRKASLEKPSKLSSVWKIKHMGPISSYNNMYPSFPTEFVERCIDLWSLPGDIILDPYAGSGQVCRVAIRKNRSTIGIEIDKQWKKLWADINDRKNE